MILLWVVVVALVVEHLHYKEDILSMEVEVEEEQIQEVILEE
jgi:hypothetical protein